MENNDDALNNSRSHGISPLHLRLLFSAFMLIVFAGLLVLAEVAARKAYPRFPLSGRIAVASLLGDNDSLRAGYYSQHPYLYYTHRSGYIAFSNLQFNSLGHRNPEVSPEASPDVIRILCIGGSTTVSFPYVENPDETWPAKLETLLERDIGRNFEVINAGLNGGNSADLLAHYIFRNRYLKPHIVILHVGGNDATALLFPDYNPEYTHYTKGWKNAALAQRPFENILLRFYLVRCAYALWLKNISLDTQIGRLGIENQKPKDCLKNVQRNEPTGFRRNLDILVRTIIQDGAKPVIFPFVWAPEDVFRRKAYGSYYDSLVLAYGKDLAVMEEIAKKHDVKLAQLPEGSIPASLFKDFCHITPSGESIKAEHMLQTLRPMLQQLTKN